MNIFKLKVLLLSFILGLATTNAFGMKRATPAPSTQETPAPSTSEDGPTPAIKQTCGEYRDPHAKKEKAAEEHQLPVAQDDDEEDTTMADEQDDEAIAAIAKEFAAIGFFQATRFRFLGRVAEAIAIRTTQNIVKTALKDLNKTLAERVCQIICVNRF